MTARRNIPGALDLAALSLLAGGDAKSHEQRSQQHRPTDPAELAGEIQRLAAQGLKARDIANALRLAEDEVVSVLNAPSLTT